MRVLREIGVGAHRGGRYNGTCRVRLAVFQRGMLLLPFGCCAHTFSCDECGWNGTYPGKKSGDSSYSMSRRSSGSCSGSETGGNLPTNLIAPINHLVRYGMDERKESWCFMKHRG